MFLRTVFKCFLSVLKLRKCRRKTSLKIILTSIGIILAISCLTLLFLYYWHKKTIDNHEDIPFSTKVKIKPVRNSTRSKRIIIVKPMKHVPLNDIYPDNTDEDVDSFEFVRKPTPMIDTNGCKIPIALVPYNRTKQKLSCGQRAVYLKKIDENKIQATIKLRTMKKYLRINGTFHCCYKFFSNLIKLKDGSRKSTYTKCKPLNENEQILLRSEFVTVKCFQHDATTTYVIYKDAYIFVKKKNVTSHPIVNNCKERYNVLVIGMDSLSLSRFEQTMPRTTKFFKDNYWLGYRAFNKIEVDAFPNLIATLTGLDMTGFSEKCGQDMMKCNKQFIWSKFKEIGYVTAYAEDYISLPEMFNNGYEFPKNPTDHYPRALFVNEEHIVNHSLVCTGRQSSGHQLLNYALDFALTYRSDSFFGLFWIHSFSHNLKSPLIEVDKHVENFFNQLSYTGVSRNTFIILMSAHGILVGDSRLNPDSFYDERMPALFFLPASTFKNVYLDMFKSLVINQGRLITPFDLHKTLMTIKQLSSCSNSTVISGTCTKCQSLTETMDNNRTCNDAAIHEKWCTCRKMYPIDTHNDFGVKSVLHVVSYLQSIIKSIKTRQCWSCSRLSLKKIIRMHFYYDQTKINLFYVVAFSMTPGDIIYEATVAQKKSEFHVVGPVSLLSDIKHIGNCTKYQYTRPYCLCDKRPNC